jgi:hypothetical protein
MKKSLFDLGQEEKTRILEMHVNATKKQYLMEQVESDSDLLLKIATKIDEITKRTEPEISSLTEEDRRMFRKLGDLQTDIMRLLVKYKIRWETLKSDMGIDDGFIKEVETLLKSVFPNNKMSDVEMLIMDFDEKLNNY